MIIIKKNDISKFIKIKHDQIIKKNDILKLIKIAYTAI